MISTRAKSSGVETDLLRPPELCKAVPNESSQPVSEQRRTKGPEHEMNHLMWLTSRKSLKPQSAWLSLNVVVVSAPPSAICRSSHLVLETTPQGKGHLTALRRSSMRARGAARPSVHQRAGG